MAIQVERMVAILEARLDKYEKGLAKARGATNRQFTAIERRGKQMESRLSSIGANFSRGFFAAIAGAASVRGAQQLIDTATRIQNALKVAGLSGDELTKVYDRLFESAQKNATPLESLVTLYGRAAIVQKELGVSTEELLNFTNNVSLALRVAGTDAGTASGALLQLSQALGSGTVRAEEFNSILEGALPIAQAAAAGLKEAGGSVAALRALVVDGKVSSEAFFRAFEAGSDILEEKVAGAQLTVSQGFVQLSNRLVDMAREFDNNTDAAMLTNKILGELGDTLESVGDWVSSAIGPLQDLAAWLNHVSASANEGAAALGRMVGADKVAGYLSHASGPIQRFDDIQKRIDQAFEASSGKQGRVTEVTASDGSSVRPRRQVSLSDFATPTSKSGGGGGKRGRGRGDSFQREVQQIKDRTAALQAETAAMAGINPLIDDYGFAVEKARSTQELLNAAQKAGIAITPDLRAKIDALAEGYANASAEAEKLQQSQEDARRAADDFRDLGKDVLGGFIQDLKDGKSATEALGKALNKVADKLLDMALPGLFSGKGGLSGGLFGGAIIPGILHSGGVAGRDGYGHGRVVSPSVFAGARRMHSGGIAGLQAGEVPAILQRGEVVLPKNTGTSGRSNDVVRVVLQDDSGRMADIADQQIRTRSGTIVQVAVQQSAKTVRQQMPGLMAEAQSRRF